MSEKKQQHVYVPLRIRFRPQTEQTPLEHQRPSSFLNTQPSKITENTTDSLVVPLPTGTQSTQHTQQIKELIRLGNVLRAELGFNEVIQQIFRMPSTWFIVNN